MPEIGRPTSPQEQQYRNVTMAPRSTGNTASNQTSPNNLEPANTTRADRDNQAIINRATGYREPGIYDQKDKSKMGKDEFLKLLTFQLQNQDPLNPMDQGKMTGELAQFSQLEQLTNLNTKFDQLQKNQQIEDKFYAANFVGKKVVTSGSSVKVNEPGESARLLFRLDKPAQKVVIRLLDNQNQTVSELWKENLSQGSQEYVWDGRTLDGQPAAKGEYKLMVKAWDQTGGEVLAQTQASGIVQSVSFDEGEPVLVVDGQKVFLRDVSSFHTAKTDEMKKMPTTQPTPSSLQLTQKPNLTTQRMIETYQDKERGIYD